MSLRDVLAAPDLTFGLFPAWQVTTATPLVAILGPDTFDPKSAPCCSAAARCAARSRAGRVSRN
jgi:hypothetical protein